MAVGRRIVTAPRSRGSRTFVGKMSVVGRLGSAPALSALYSSYVSNASTLTPVASKASRPPKPSNSMTKIPTSGTPPKSRISLAPASAVPPVAIKSSTNATFAPGLMLSFGASRRSVPYSRVFGWMVFRKHAVTVQGFWRWLLPRSNENLLPQFRRWR